VMFDFVGYNRWVVTPHHVTKSGEYHWQAKRLRIGEKPENRILAVFADTAVGKANAEKLAAATTERF
jgi:hypothetical protein